MFTTRRKGIIAILCAVFAAALIACAISLAPSATRTAPVYAAEGDLQVTEIVDTNNPSTTYATVEKAVAAGIKFIIDTDEPGVYNGYTSLYNTMWGGFKPNDTLILLQDCETAYIQLSNGSVIDLNGHNLTYTGTSTIIFSGRGREATITDTSVSGSERGGTLNITGERDGAKSVFEIGATLNVSNINIDSTGCVFYPRGSTAKLNITNCDITTTGIFCVATNAGDQAYYGVTINIADSSLTAAAENYDDCAIMMNVSGSLNIENSVITGDRQGLFVRAGDVTVVNSEIVLTGNWAAQEVNDENAYHNEDWQSGNEAPSAAIVAGNRNGTYFADANVTIENSTITAPKEVVAIYVDATSTPQGTAEESYSSDVSISGAETSVTGSIVNNATDGDGKSIEIAVTGGTFTADVAEYIPEGTILTQDESGKIVEDESSVNSAVAEAGGVKYTTLQGAIDAAADGAVVTMLADTAEDITIAEGQDITLDLNGNTLANVIGHTITNSGTLTIVDSGENGTVDNISNGRGALVNYGTATLNGGTFTRSLEAGTYEPYGGNGNSWYTLKNYGCLTINEGSTVTTRLSDGEKAVGGFSSLIANGYQDSTDYNDNKDLVTVTENEATVVINGGSFSGGINTLKNDEGSTAEINGGTFINVTQAAVQNWNKLTITGGTFNAENDNVDAVITGCWESDIGSNGTSVIEGGVFNGAVTYIDGYSGGIDYEISGGTFTQEVNTAYIAEGSVLYTTDGDSFTVGTDDEAIDAGISIIIDGIGYTEIPEGIVATVGAEGEVPAGYESLQDAIDAAADGDIVTLLSDIGTEESGINGILFARDDETITIDLNGYDIYVSNTASYFIRVSSGTLNIVNSAEEASDINAHLDVFQIMPNGTDVAKLVLGENLNVTSEIYSAVWIQPTGKSSGDLTINAYLETSANLNSLNEGLTDPQDCSATIQGNGTAHGTSITINGGTVYNAVDTAIYHPQYGEITVNGGEIYGERTGIEIRAGILTVNGGTITGNGDPFAADPNGNGSTAIGAAVAVSQHSTDLELSAVINGGTLVGARALYEADLQNATGRDEISLSVTGGTFNGDISSENVSAFVTGGKFSEAFDSSYVADGSVLYTTDGDSFTVGTDDEAIAADIKIIIDGVGYTEIPESVVATVGAEGKVPAGYESLQDAIDAAADGETVKLLKNITVDGRVNIYKSLTLDMQGYKISGGMLYINGGTTAGNSITVNISNGSVIGPTYGIIVFNDVTLNIKDVNISAGTHNGIFVPLTAYDGDTTVLPSTINIEGGSVSGGNTESAASVAICGVGDNSETATKLIANGTTFTGGTFGITGNGTAHNTYIELNDCVVTGSVGIYHPQDGDLIINGGEITGDVTGIEIRSGTLTVNSGTITGNGDPFESDPNGNGTTTTGAAIAVTQHTTNLPITVTINGGTFNGIRALYEADLQDEVTEGVTIEVTGGTFNGEVYSENCTGFIAGGQFAEKPDDSYLDSEFTGFSEYNGMFIPVSSSTDGTLLEEIAQLRQEIDDAIAAINGELEGGDAATLAEAVTALIGKMNELEDKIAELDENMVTDADLQALRNSITVAYNAAVSRVRAELSAQISDLRDSMAEMGDVSGQLDELKAAYEAADALLSAEIDDLRAELTEADAELVAELDAAISELESTYKAADDAIWNAIYALRDADSGMTTALWVIGVIAVLALCAGVAGVAFAIVRTKRS